MPLSTQPTVLVDAATVLAARVPFRSAHDPQDHGKGNCYDCNTGDDACDFEHVSSFVTYFIFDLAPLAVYGIPGARVPTPPLSVRRAAT